jgi:hypothetical protein
MAMETHTEFVSSSITLFCLATALAERHLRSAISQSFWSLILVTVSCLFTPAYEGSLEKCQQRLLERTYSSNLSLLACAYTQEA